MQKIIYLMKIMDCQKRRKKLLKYKIYDKIDRYSKMPIND